MIILFISKPASDLSAVREQNICVLCGNLVFVGINNNYLRTQHYPEETIVHYENTPMQYTAIFHGGKNVHFQMLFFFKYFSYFCSKH